MARKRHVLMPTKSLEIPSDILVFDTETQERASAEDATIRELTFKLGACYFYRLEKGKRTRERWYELHSPEEFWIIVRSRLVKGRHLHLVAHNTAFDLHILRAWGELSEGDYLWNRCILESSPFLMEGWSRGCKITITDTFNYHKSSLAQIGKSLGVQKAKVDFATASDAELMAYCKQDVYVTAAAFDSLIDFHCGNKLGKWATTAAGLAMNAFLGSFMEDAILIHDNERALKLERNAYYGGVVQCSRLGPQERGPFTELDVNSHYPRCMLEDMPIGNPCYRESLTPRSAVRFLGDRYGIADISLVGSKRAFPVRRNGKLCRPVGTYRTTLAMPELQQAFREGTVGHVHRIAAYETAPIFRKYVDHFYSAKLKAERDGNTVHRTLMKLYLNSLYGKFGQMSPRWRQWNGETWEHIEQVYSMPRGSLSRHADFTPRIDSPTILYHVRELGVSFEVRDLFGFIEIATARGESRNSSPAIAATVTSWGRRRLLHLIDLCGPGHHYYSDTDSIVTDDYGKKRLEDAGWVEPGTLGKLSVKGQYSRLCIYGPKDVIADDDIRRKGVKKRAIEVADGTYRQDQFEGIKSFIYRMDDGTVRVTDTLKFLRRTPDQWLVPCRTTGRLTDWCQHSQCIREGIAHGCETRPLVFPRDDE